MWSFAFASSSGPDFVFKIKFSAEKTLIWDNIHGYFVRGPTSVITRYGNVPHQMDGFRLVARGFQVNRNQGNVAYMQHFSNQLRSRVSSVVIFWSQATYDGYYERSALVLQHRSFNHPQSLRCEGAVPLRKSCLDFCFVQYAYFFDHKHRPWRPPAQLPAS